MNLQQADGEGVSRCEHNSIIIARRPRRSDLETEEVRFILNKYDLLCLALRGVRAECAKRRTKGQSP